MKGLMNVLGGITSFYMILIFIRIMLTWFSGASYGRAYKLLANITDPYLDWFHRFSFLRVANLDLSPIAALALLSVANNVFLTLSRYGRITLGVVLSMVISTIWSAASFILSFFIIVLALRFIAYLTNRDVYHGFWRIVDMISQPVLYRINRLVFGRRLVRYTPGIVSALGILAVLRVGLELLVRFGLKLLVQLPF